MTGLDNRLLLTLILALSTAGLMFALSFLILCRVNKEKIHINNRIKKLFNEKNNNIYRINKVKNRKSIFDRKMNLKIVDSIAEELLLADVLMKPEEYLIIWIVLTFVPSGLFALVDGNPLTALFLAVMGAMLPPFYLKTQKKKRLAKFENQLGDTLVIISNCLKSGLTFNQSLDNIASEMPEPTSREFSRVVREIKYGNSIETALNNMVNRINSQDLSLTVSAVLIQRQVGGNLAEILTNISETIKERLKIKNEIKVLTATGRISGIVIGMIPVAIAGILLLVNPDYMLLFFEKQLGIIMLVISGVLELLGFLFVRKIVSVKY